MTGARDISEEEVSEHGSWRVIRVAEATSTNTELLALATVGELAGRIALMADHQTVGRGRLNRVWDAPPGVNLLVSLLFDGAHRHAARLTQAVGLAAVRAVESLAGRPIRDRIGLKWPNDVLLDERKLAGILAQRDAQDGPIVVGLGLNVGWAPDGAASLAANLDLDVSCRDVLEALFEALVTIEHMPDEEFMHSFVDRMSTIGRRVRVELPGDRELIGDAIGLDAEGRLRVEAADGSGIRELDVGDVVHLRAAD